MRTKVARYKPTKTTRLLSKGTNKATKKVATMPNFNSL